MMSEKANFQSKVVVRRAGSTVYVYADDSEGSCCTCPRFVTWLPGSLNRAKRRTERSLKRHERRLAKAKAMVHNG